MSDPLFDDSDREAFDKAIEKWGINAQVNMAEEEAAEIIIEFAEFIVKSRHYDRGKIDTDEMIDELADVRIMYEQLAMFIGREAVERRVETKMDRLRERLEDE